MCCHNDQMWLSGFSGTEVREAVVTTCTSLFLQSRGLSLAVTLFLMYSPFYHFQVHPCPSCPHSLSHTQAQTHTHTDTYPHRLPLCVCMTLSSVTVLHLLSPPLSFLSCACIDSFHFKCARETSSASILCLLTVV